MSTKTLQSRIKLKYDTLANWTSQNPVLLQGEVAVVAVSSGNTQLYNSITAPQILFKVGDNTHQFNDLPWASGLAADVYNWAKQEHLEWGDVNSEHFLSGLSTYIEGNIGGDLNVDPFAQASLTGTTLTINGIKELSGKIATDSTQAVTINVTDGAGSSAAKAFVGKDVLDTAITDLSNTVDNIISSLDYSDSAETSKFVTVVSETDGKISVSRAQPEISDVNGLNTALNNALTAANHYTDQVSAANHTAWKTEWETYTDNAIDGLDATVASAYEATDQQQVVTGVKVTEVDGKLSTIELSSVTLAKVAKTGKAEDVALTAVTGLTATNLQAAAAELYQKIQTGGEESVVTLSSATGTGDVLKTYTIYQGGNSVGSIDIPKDFLVKSAEVKVCSADNDPVSGLNVGDKYLDFTVNTKDTQSEEGTHMYIPVKSFADAYTGHTGTNIDVTISDYVVSADLTQAVKNDIAAKAYLSVVSAYTISGENGLSSSGDLGTGIKVGHNTTGVAVAEQAGKFVKSVTVDAYGHVTGGTLSAVNVTTDLYQPDGDYLILDCGSASTVI